MATTTDDMIDITPTWRAVLIYVARGLLSQKPAARQLAQLILIEMGDALDEQGQAKPPLKVLDLVAAINS